MKKILRYSSIVLLAVSLVGCSSVDKGGEGDGSSTAGTSAVIHLDYSDTVDGDPQPECIPMHAPTDYLGVDPADADPYDAYFFIAHKRANSTTLYMTRGSAVANITSSITYEQRIANLTMNDGTTVFNMFATTGGITSGSLDMQIISKASRAFEDIDNDIYVGQETSDSSDISIDFDLPEGVYTGSVTNWGDTQEAQNRQTLFDRFGHDLFATPPFYVPDASAIASASMRPDGDNYVFTFTFSLVDDDTHTNAATYYSETLNDGVAQGAIVFEITELTWSATVNSDWEMLSTYSTETYSITASFLPGVEVPCVNITEGELWYYDDIFDCDNESAAEQWNAAVRDMNMVDLDTFDI